ncbi:MAG: adenylate/guanylate cyclase domain-containing protein [bacterium]|nr:adenylate/guanylate cyclase domain-containing protein [bacterium]
MVQDQVRVGRRLSAILAADVVGYSRLMGIDEVGTARRLREHRAVIDALIARHGGRIVKTTGDGLLLEYASVVDAVECAIAVQAVMTERNAGVAPDGRMVFRIGINLGDILIEGDDILGDGVNVAARLEGIAEPGGICLSAAAYDQVREKVAVEFADLGEHRLKNIARPIRAYSVVRDGSGANRQDSQATARMPSAGTSSSGAPSIPRLSLLVLPFANIGGDPEQDYFADGVTESLITDLSRISGSFVIARNTAFTFKGKAVDVKQVGRELNVRYVLEGSVQRSGNRLRVNVQLINTEAGNHLWAERFDKTVADLFDMQDEIVSRLANALNAQFIAVEAQRAERSPNPDAVDLNFQGKAWYNKGPTPEYMAQARAFFQRSLALDSANIEAMVGVAMVDATVGATDMADDRLAHYAAAEANLTKVLSLAPNNAMAHRTLALVLMLTRRPVQGIAECEQTLAIDRNSAGAHGLIGYAKYLLGRGAETEHHINEAFRLSPRDTSAHIWMLWTGLAKSQVNAGLEAVAWMRRGLELNRNFSSAYFHLAAELALLGEKDQARAAAQAGLALDPGFTIRRFRAGTATEDPAYLAGRERSYEGLRIAGLPEA